MPVFMPKNLAALANVAAKEATRYSANALHVIDLGDTYRVEATDGKRLAVVRGPCPEAQYPVLDAVLGGAADVLVPAESWREAFRTKGKKDLALPVGLVADATSFRLAVGQKVIEGALPEGRFPAFSAVLPKKPAICAVKVDPVLLAGLLQAAAALDPSGGVSLLFYGREQPLGVMGRNEAGQFFDGMLQPLT
jgi:DNA polymerase III sliding clamp (beta) subunit (PCNA family)